MKYLVVMGLVSGMALSLSAQANVLSAKIKSTNKKRAKIVVFSKSLKGIESGDVLNFGDDCPLEVTKRYRNKAVLSTELCENTKALRKGKKIRLSSDSQGNISSTTRGSFQLDDREYSSTISSGFRVGFLKSFLGGEATASRGSYGISVEDDDVNQKWGLSLGYAHIKANNFGGMGSLSYNEFQNDGKSVRLDGSLTYGIGSQFYLLAGPNLHKLVNSGADYLDIGLGFQVGAGFQITETFGLNANYVNLNNSGNKDGTDVELDLSGLELGLHATF